MIAAFIAPPAAAALVIALVLTARVTIPHGAHAAPRQVVPPPRPNAAVFHPATRQRQPITRPAEVPSPRPYVPPMPEALQPLGEVARLQAVGRELAWREAVTGSPWMDDTGTFRAIHFGGQR